MVNWFIYILLVIIILFSVYFFGGRENIQVNELNLNEGYSYFENEQGKTAYYSTGKNDSEPLILIHGVSAVSYTHLTLPTILLV